MSLTFKLTDRRLSIKQIDLNYDQGLQTYLYMTPFRIFKEKANGCLSGNLQTFFHKNASFKIFSLFLVENQIFTNISKVTWIVLIKEIHCTDSTMWWRTRAIWIFFVSRLWSANKWPDFRFFAIFCDFLKKFFMNWLISDFIPKKSEKTIFSKKNWRGC